MLIYHLLEGILIGFLASVPLGPVNILVIQRTISNSRKEGFYSGLGVALSDTLYASFAGFSVAFVFQLIKEYDIVFRIVVSAVLLTIGLIILLSKPKNSHAANSGKNNHLKQFFTTFLLTVSNPLVVFLHIALFAAFGVVFSIKSPYAALFVIVGFILGAIIWWFSITGIISRFRNFFSLKICLWFNRIAGSVIILLITGSLILFFLP